MADNTKQDKKPVTLKGLKFLVGSIVYLKTDPYQSPRIVTAIHLTPGDYKYEVRLADDEPSVHYAVELSEEKSLDTLIESMSNEEDE
jgi:hypothetical protein